VLPKTQERERWEQIIDTEVRTDASEAGELVGGEVLRVGPRSLILAVLRSDAADAGSGEP
jgi:hypothetical protein